MAKEKAKVEMDEQGRIEIDKHTQMLPCKLTDDEFEQAADALAKVLEDIDNEAGRANDMKQQLKARMTELEARRSRIASTVRRREEPRDVQVVEMLTAEGTVQSVRTDTGEMTHERVARDEERQLRL